MNSVPIEAKINEANALQSELAGPGKVAIYFKGNLLTGFKAILYFLYLGTIEQLQLGKNLKHGIRMNILNQSRHILNNSIHIEPGWYPLGNSLLT